MLILEEQFKALNTTLAQILTAVQALSPAKLEDLTPVVTAIGNVQTSVNTIAASFATTPNA